MPQTLALGESFKYFRNAALVLGPSRTPSLVLDFAGGAYRRAGTAAASFLAMSGASFTRASTGYARTTAGLLVPFASGAPRITDRGFLIEEASTNLIANNSGVGAVVGTPGTLPTGQSLNTNITGLSYAVTGLGTEHGLPYWEVRIYGTPSGSGYYEFLSPRVAAVIGETFTASRFVKRVAGTNTNITAVRIAINEENAGPSYVGGSQSASAPFDGSLQYLAYTATMGQATCAYSLPLLNMTVTAGPVDVTFRVYGLQFEKKAFATSPIITTGAAATRAQDVSIVSNLGSIMVEPWTLVVDAEFSTLISGVQQYLAPPSKGSAPPANRVRFYRNQTDGSIIVNVVDNGVDGAGGSLATAVKPGIRVVKTAIRFRPTTVALSCDGASVISITQNSPDFDRLDLGQGAGGGYGLLNGYLRSVSIFGDLTDAELTAASA